MEISDILEILNPAQREAVTAAPGHLLILAGAGSGKTRVLVHRISWLLRTEQISPFSILAVTFTNKAAQEMRSRIETIVGTVANGMWIGTFHSLAHRLLRLHWQDARLPQNFQIMDSDDQYRLIRRVLRNLSLDEQQWSPKQIQWFINNKKDHGLRPEHIEHYGEPYAKTMVSLYQAYEQTCQQSGLVDFAELLLRSHEIWLQNPSLLTHYQQRFKHILVDEFQDTNTIQYAWLKLLAGEHNYLNVVGDDDQSIYGWRGAKIENIQRFHQDFLTVRAIRLEQNYRSSGIILAAANALIDNNDGRLGKNLWTDGDEGELITLYTAFNENDEARYIVQRIKNSLESGHAYREHAILYRSNAQSRVLEEALIHANLPYRIYGGQRFFERAEIKDALSYLRLIDNRHDDAAFERIVNVPTRGIGERTIEELRLCARNENISLWRAANLLITNGQLSGRAANAVKNFCALIDTLANEVADLSLAEQVAYVIHNSGLVQHWENEKGEKAQNRLDNLDELVNAARQYYVESDTHISILSAFLAHAALEAGDAQQNNSADSIQLMTLHSAKGLEFYCVFLAGLEEGTFPHRMSIEDTHRLEEERRLCYVGITRAMQKLYITYAENRRLYGTDQYFRPSRFIREIPKDLIQEVRLKTSTTYLKRSSNDGYKTPSILKTTTQAHGLKIGQHVMHQKFGEGIVLNFEGQGAQARVQVKFAGVGTKWLVVGYANLTSV